MKMKLYNFILIYALALSASCCAMSLNESTVDDRAALYVCYTREDLKRISHITQPTIDKVMQQAEQQMASFCFEVKNGTKKIQDLFNDGFSGAVPVFAHGIKVADFYIYGQSLPSRLLKDEGNLLHWCLDSFSEDQHQDNPGPLENIINFLLSRYPLLVNGKDKRGETPLHYACAARNNKWYLLDKVIAQFLAVPGINLDEKNCDGKSPLALAIEAGNPRSVNFLLAKNACPWGASIDAVRACKNPEIVAAMHKTVTDARKNLALALLCGTKKLETTGNNVSIIIGTVSASDFSTIHFYDPPDTDLPAMAHVDPLIRTFIQEKDFSEPMPVLDLQKYLGKELKKLVASLQEQQKALRDISPLLESDSKAPDEIVCTKQELVAKGLSYTEILTILEAAKILWHEKFSDYKIRIGFSEWFNKHYCVPTRVGYYSPLGLCAINILNTSGKEIVDKETLLHYMVDRLQSAQGTAFTALLESLHYFADNNGISLFAVPTIQLRQTAFYRLCGINKPEMVPLIKKILPQIIEQGTKNIPKDSLLWLLPPAKQIVSLRDPIKSLPHLFRICSCPTLGEAVIDLLKVGFDPNAHIYCEFLKKKQEVTPLALALWHTNSKAVEELLKKDASPYAVCIEDVLQQSNSAQLNLAVWGPIYKASQDVLTCLLKKPVKKGSIDVAMSIDDAAMGIGVSKWLLKECLKGSNVPTDMYVEYAILAQRCRNVVQGMKLFIEQKLPLVKTHYSSSSSLEIEFHDEPPLPASHELSKSASALKAEFITMGLPIKNDSLIKSELCIFSNSAPTSANSSIIYHSVREASMSGSFRIMDEQFDPQGQDSLKTNHSASSDD